MFQPTCHWQEKVFFILVIFNCWFGCVLARERNEMVENWPITFFSLSCPGLTCMVLYVKLTKDLCHWSIRCINSIYTEGANFII